MTREYDMRIRLVLSMPPDLAPESVLERVLASRRHGTRVLLPIDDGAVVSNRRHPVLHAILAAAAALILVAVASWIARPRHQRAPLPESIAAGFFAGDFGFAESAPPHGAAKPAYPPIVLDPGRLHPVTLRYARTVIENDSLLSADTPTVTLTRTNAGRWDVITRREIDEYAGASRAAFVDTLSLDAVTLEATEIVRTGTSNKGGGGGSRIAVDGNVFHVTDTLFGARPESYHDTWTLPRIAGYHRLFVPSLGEMMAVLMAAPFDGTTRGGMTALIPRRDGALVLVAVNLRVTGDTTLARSSGAVPCWRITAPSTTDGEHTTTFLVRKNNGVLMAAVTEGVFRGRRNRVDTELIGGD